MKLGNKSPSPESAKTCHSTTLLPLLLYLLFAGTMFCRSQVFTAYERNMSCESVVASYSSSLSDFAIALHKAAYMQQSS